MYRVRCVRQEGGFESSQEDSGSRDVLTSIVAQYSDDRSEIFCKGWRLVGVPPNLSASTVKQHPTAAEAAAAVAELSTSQSTGKVLCKGEGEVDEV